MAPNPTGCPHRAAAPRNVTMALPHGPSIGLAPNFVEKYLFVISLDLLFSFENTHFISNVFFLRSHLPGILLGENFTTLLLL